MDINDLVSGVLGSPTPNGAGLLSGLASPSTNLGLALLANSGPTRLPTTFGQALGQSAIQAQDMAAQNVERRAQLAQSLLSLQMLQGRNNAFQAAYGAAPGQGGSPTSSPTSPPTGPSPGSAGTPTAQVQQANQNSPLAKWLAPPTEADIAATPVGGMTSPQVAPLLAMYSGQDPLKAASEVRAQQLAAAKLRYAPEIAKLEGVVQSDSPTRDVKADPLLMSLWTQFANERGMDAAKDFTDANLRQAFGGAANQYRAALSEPTVAPPIPLTPQGINRVTGKYEGGEPKAVIGANGQPVLVAPQDAIGKTPFTPSIFGAANASDQAIQFAADTYRSTGKFPVGMSRNPMLQARVLERIAADAAANGDTAGAIQARTAATKANSQALDQITKREAAVNSFSRVMEKNLDNLQAAYDKAGSLGSPLLNRALRAWQQGGSGDPDTAAMITYLNAVQGEYAKLKAGSLGNQGSSDAARREAAEVINKAMTTGGIAAVRQAMLTEAQNNRDVLEEQKNELTSRINVAAPGSPNSTPTPKPPTPTSGYRSAADVKAAYSAGKITRAQAKQILTSQFGMQ